MIGFPLGLLFANAFEWYAHKHLLHGVRRTPKGPRESLLPTTQKSHWKHHKRVRGTRRAGAGGSDDGDAEPFRDASYEAFLKDHDRRREVLSLVALGGATSLALPVAPFFTLGTWYAAVNYYRTHSRAHRDPAWARRHLPWHVDHHLNANEDANWCVTRPWFDYVMGTRVVSSPELEEANPLGFAGWHLPATPTRLLKRRLRRVWEPADHFLAAGDRPGAADSAADAPGGFSEEPTLAALPA